MAYYVRKIARAKWALLEHGAENVIENYKHRLTRAHREKQLKMSCQALHNAPPNRT